MPISLKESWRQFPSPSENLGAETNEASQAKTGGIVIPFGNLYLRLEPRSSLIFVLILPLYALAAFVGNDWAYMLPCTMLACLIIGVVLPLLEVSSIDCSASINRNAVMKEQEIILKAWRLPFFGVFSHLIPSGYLNARLHLMRRNWKGAKKIPSELPLPVVLHSLSSGMEIRVSVPQLRRGVYELDSLEISTCFPFALAWWFRKIELEKKDSDACITVLPELHDLSGNFHSRLNSSRASAGMSPKNWILQHRSSSLRGLREFTERDSLFQIHWASSARTGKFMVREFEIESLPDYDVFLDLMQSWTDRQFDLACSAAYALVHYGYRMGFTPQLRLNPPLDWEPMMEQVADIQPGLSGEELVVEMLARLSPLPPELRNSYRDFESEHRRSAMDLSNDISVSARATIALLSQDKSSKGIVLVEVQNGFSAAAVADPGARTVGVLASLESEVELLRV